MLKLIIMLSFLFSVQVSANMKDLIDHMCKMHEATDCDLVHAVAWKETKYKNDIVYDVTSFSYGPMQIKCGTAKLNSLPKHLIYNCDQLENPKVSLRFAIYYLEYQIKRYKGNIKDAISAYNLGTVIICKDYNPGHCYPGEHYNYNYVEETWRRYKWLRRKKQKSTQTFLPNYRNFAGQEISQISTR